MIESQIAIRENLNSKCGLLNQCSSRFFYGRNVRLSTQQMIDCYIYNGTEYGCGGNTFQLLKDLRDMNATLQEEEVYAKSQSQNDCEIELDNSEVSERKIQIQNAACYKYKIHSLKGTFISVN